MIFTALSCGEQEIRAIDEFSIAPGGVNSPKDRGLVQVRDGNLLTDKGTRLRGVTLGVDVFPPRTPLAPELFTELAHSGLNAFHVYLENSAIETGSRLALADDLVELTSASGLYLVITLGGGNAGGRSTWKKRAHSGSFTLPATLAELTSSTRFKTFQTRAAMSPMQRMPFRTSVEDVAQLENEGVGWFNFEYLVRTRDLAAFRSAHDAAALTWCPDFGTWPEDAETCRTP